MGHGAVAGHRARVPQECFGARNAVIKDVTAREQLVEHVGAELDERAAPDGETFTRFSRPSAAPTCPFVPGVQ